MLSRERALLFVLLFAVVVRLAIFALHHPFAPLSKDDSVYDELGWNMISGNGYSAGSAPPYKPMAVRPPGYPAFLGAVYSVAGRNPDAVRLVQIGLSLLTCALIFVLARRLIDLRHAIGASGLYAAMPSAAHYTSLVLTEASQALLLIAAVYCAYRAAEHPRRFLWFGACALALAAATLVRTDAQLLAVPMFAMVCLSASNWKRPVGWAVVATGCVALLVAPWAIRNYQVFGRYIGLSSGSGHVLLVAQLEAEGKAGSSLNAEIERRYGAAFQQRHGRPMTYIDGALPDQDAVRRRDAVEFIRANPGAFVRHSADRAIRLWLPSSWSGAFLLNQDFSEYYADRRLGALVGKGALLAVDAAVLALAAVGILFSLVHWRRFGIALTPLIYFSLMYTLVYSGSRYRVPLLPLVALFASYGLARVAALVRVGTGRQATDSRSQQAVL